MMRSGPKRILLLSAFLVLALLLPGWGAGSGDPAGRAGPYLGTAE